MWSVSVPAGEEKGLGRGGCQVSARLGFSVADQPQLEGRRSCVKASGTIWGLVCDHGKGWAM